MDYTDRPNAGQQANSARDSTTPPAGCIDPDRIAPAVAADPRWYGFRWNGKGTPPAYFHFPSADEVTLDPGEPVAIIPAPGKGSSLDVTHAALLDGANLDGIAMLAPGAKRPELFNSRDRWLLWTKESTATQQEKITLLDALGYYDEETRAILIEHGMLPKPPAGNGQDHQAAELHQAAEWPEPEPLPTALHPVKLFDAALLPESLRPWLCDIQERVQCPLDYLAVSVMCALGSLIGTRVAIRPQARTDWSEVPNQWGLLIGRPAMLKTPAMEQTLAPLKRLAALAIEKHQADMREFKAEALTEKLRAEARERQAREKLKSTPSADITGLLVADEPVEPTLRRYIANNTTAEALGELLRQNTYGLLVYRDELVSLLRSLETEEAAEARGFYLQAWNGTGAYTFDRIVRGLNLHIPLVCLSVLGATQPARIASSVNTARSGGEFDDGMLQRFGLMVWPDDPGAWKNVDRFPDSKARATASQVFKYLDGLDLSYIQASQDTTPDGEPDGLPYLRFSDEALEIFIDWRTELEADLRSDAYSDALVSHFTKYRKLIPSLALLLHLTDRKTGPVGKVPLLQALAWSEYLKEHATRVYRSGTHAEVPAARAIIAKLRTGALKSPFASKAVWRPQWTYLTESEQVGRALNFLVEYGWLAAETQPSGHAGGRTKVIYTANPRWLKS